MYDLTAPKLQENKGFNLKRPVLSTSRGNRDAREAPCEARRPVMTACTSKAAYALLAGSTYTFRRVSVSHPRRPAWYLDMVIIRRLVPFPEPFPVFPFEVFRRQAAVGLIDVYTAPIFMFNPFHQLERLFEVIERVDEDERRRIVRDLAQHVQLD